MAWGLKSHQGTTNVQSVEDRLKNVSPTENLYLAGSRTFPDALQQTHQWTDDYDYTPDGTSIHQEGEDTTYADLTQPTYKTNLTMEFDRGIRVSSSQIASQFHGSKKDAYKYQLEKGERLMAGEMNRALLLSTLTSGATGTVRRMNGLLALITSNKTARTSGTSFTETQLDTIFSEIWGTTDYSTSVSSDMIADELYVGKYLKKVINSFTGVVGQITQDIMDDRRIVNKRDFYETDHSNTLVKLFKDRWIPTSGVLALKSGMYGVAYLNGRRPNHELLAKTGTAVKGHIDAEMTAMIINERTCAYSSGWFVG